MLFVCAQPCIVQHVFAHLRVPDDFIQFALGQPPGQTGVLAVAEQQLRPTVETELQVVLGVCPLGSLAAWHEMHKPPYYSRAWRKLCAKTVTGILVIWG